MSTFTQKRTFEYIDGSNHKNSSPQETSQERIQLLENQAFEKGGQGKEIIAKENIHPHHIEKDKHFTSPSKDYNKSNIFIITEIIEMTFEKFNTKESSKKISQNKIKSKDENQIEVKKVKSSKKKHYKINFDPKWPKKGDPHYKDWIKRVENEDDKFFDFACNKKYDCEYLSLHKKTESHKVRYK